SAIAASHHRPWPLNVTVRWRIYSTTVQRLEPDETGYTTLAINWPLRLVLLQSAEPFTALTGHWARTLDAVIEG
ncbi:hypothetical protein LB507_008515, partial [Fusarium sp. FIESC RH6]